ncbi:MAG: Calx-beta domain-containing protein [Acidobacteriota bacterium]
MIKNSAASSVVVIFVVVFGCCSFNADAATRLVTSSLDSGPGTLREAVAAAEAGDTILISVPEVRLRGTIIVDQDITLAGDDCVRLGTAALRIIGNGTFRLILVENGVTLELRDVLLEDGFAGDGAGGGAIFNYFSNLKAVNCFFSENHQVGSIGGGAVLSLGYAEFTNCGFMDNTSSGAGGAIYGDVGYMKLTNCTIRRNSAEEIDSMLGGGVAVLGNLTMTNTIVWGNDVNGNPQDVYSLFGPAEGSHNVIGVIDGPSNLTDTINEDPLFSDGWDPMGLLPESPCIDAGTDAGAPERDFHYYPRPMIGEIPTGPGLGFDIGAVEYEQGDLDAVVTYMTGMGSGTITSEPSGIHHGTCWVAWFIEGTTVSLTATPDPDSVFTGWTTDTGGDPDFCNRNLGGFVSPIHCYAGFEPFLAGYHGSLDFAPDTYTVEENAGLVEITVSRSSGSIDNRVFYTTQDGTATAGEDYLETWGILTWYADDFTPQTIVVEIIDDATMEGDENFTVALRNATYSVLGADVATVRIVDSLIFWDGFETGSTQGWSSTAP